MEREASIEKLKGKVAEGETELKAKVGICARPRVHPRAYARARSHATERTQKNEFHTRSRPKTPTTKSKPTGGESRVCVHCCRATAIPESRTTEERSSGDGQKRADGAHRQDLHNRRRAAPNP